MTDPACQATLIGAIGDVAADAWNQLIGSESVFLRHEFLNALELSGSVGPGTGWVPCHIVAHDAHGALCGAMPLYQKTDSWGEFVFDFAWADAYHRAGLDYYPKLVSGVPFTPATGKRCLHAPGTNASAIGRNLLARARRQVTEVGASSLHVLFPDAGDRQLLEADGLMIRKDCQFHWHNHDFADFDEFLGTFTADKRKKARRERRRVSEAGIRYRTLTGADLDAAWWERLLPLYASTFWRRGREPYINADFFHRIATALPDRIVVFVAEHGDEAVGTAICFRDADTLYGRYWGSTGRYHSLHFETCYYQGIEYCIDQGLRRFEPGTQGEHKLSRGFVPTETYSAHWLSHPQFANAVDHYLTRETAYIEEYMEAAASHTPYRRGERD